MIDFKNDRTMAHLFSVIDQRTGACLDSQTIAWADDEAACYRVYLKDMSGHFYFDADGRAATETRRAAIAIVPRAGLAPAMRRLAEHFLATGRST